MERASLLEKPYLNLTVVCVARWALDTTPKASPLLTSLVVFSGNWHATIALFDAQRNDRPTEGRRKLIR